MKQPKAGFTVQRLVFVDEVFSWENVLMVHGNTQRDKIAARTLAREINSGENNQYGPLAGFPCRYLGIYNEVIERFG